MAEKAESAFKKKEQIESPEGKKTERICGNLKFDKRTVNGYRTALDLISRGVSASELSKLFVENPDYNPEGYLRGSAGSLTTISVGFERKLLTVSQGIVSSPEQQKVLSDLLGFLQGRDVPEEVRENLKRVAKDQGEADFQRLSTVMSMSVPSPAGRSVKEWADKFEKSFRRATLEKDFFDRLEKKLSFDEINAFLSGFEGKEQEDLAVVAKLRGIATNVRRSVFVADTVEALNRSPRNNDAVLASIEQFAKSGNESDIKVARTLAEATYEAEIATFKAEVWGMIKPDQDPAMIRVALNKLPIRPSLGRFDYIATAKETRDAIVRQLDQFEKINRLGVANEIRDSFETAIPVNVLGRLNNLRTETAEDQQVKIELLDLYRSYLAAKNPAEFDRRFAGEIEKQRAETLKAQFSSPELGNNRDGLEYLRENYYSVISPLVESFRSDATTRDTMMEYARRRKEFRQRVGELEKQRPLTDLERAYLQTVELLTIFNPNLVGAVYADPGVTTEYLRHHFTKLSEETTEGLKDGDYVPLLQIGLGPNGLAALGEVARNNSELARQMLLVDTGNQPGGPFAIPEGAAWELNSANRRGVGGPVLPDTRARENPPELARVRAYGSPLRWYPGERVPGADVRQGSINVTVDYLPAPDELSTARYPTNEELAIILSLQTAMLASKLALRTKVIEVAPNTDNTKRGDKVVTLEMLDREGNAKRINITTDAVFNSSGLGSPSYGFPLDGSRAQKILEETKDAEFPKISTTLEAFSALSTRRGEPISPGRSLIIYGSGNSADTLIEFIGNIFQGNNPRVRDVTKIYLVATGDLSSRPRYAALADVKARNGRGNLIEFVKAKVGDIDYASSDGDPAGRSLRVLDPTGKVLVGEDGKPIEGDAVIAAVGFRPEVDAVFSKYLDDGQKFKDKSSSGPTEPVKLPTNEEVSVGETLKKDPNIVFLGTASNPDFQNVDKLIQLPREAREALIRNGAENAVAIGFRAPDTQAAVNIWLNSREVQLTPEQKEARRRVPVEGAIEPGVRQRVVLGIDPSNMRVPDNMTNETLLLSPLLSYTLKNNGLITSNGEGFTGELQFRIAREGTYLTFSFVGGEGAPRDISEDFSAEVARLCQDEDFQRYAVSALQKKRRDASLTAYIRYRNGAIDQQNTFVQS